MIVTAVDAHTGELAAFDRNSGVDPVDAVTASCALPGLVPTVTINGARYIDGGVRSLDQQVTTAENNRVGVTGALAPPRELSGDGEAPPP